MNSFHFRQQKKKTTNNSSFFVCSNIFIYRNKNTFTEGETIFSYESDSTSIIQTLSADSFDVSSNFSYKTGQKGTFYDYGTIVRNSGVQEPTKKLIVGKDEAV